jgi:hypothetical protein
MVATSLRTLLTADWQRQEAAALDRLVRAVGAAFSWPENAAPAAESHAAAVALAEVWDAWYWLGGCHGEEWHREQLFPGEGREKVRYYGLLYARLYVDAAARGWRVTSGEFSVLAAAGRVLGIATVMAPRP